MSYYRYSNPNYFRPSFFGGFHYFALVIKWLLISNVLVFLLAGFALRGAPFDAYTAKLLYLFPVKSGDFQVWQLFTYMFMHGSFMHLFFNMFALWMFGMQLENDWGSRKFLVYYFLCGIGAGISNLILGPLFGASAPTVGASGAIYGVLLAFGITYPNQHVFMVPFFIPVPAKYVVSMYIVLEVLSLGATDGVAHFAHLGGAAVGFVYLMIARRGMSFQRMFSKARDQFVPRERVGEYSSYQNRNVTDAKYYDLHDEEDRINQEQIDEILDKISQHGYQSLSEKEKKILFDASKKLN